MSPTEAVLAANMQILARVLVTVCQGQELPNLAGACGMISKKLGGMLETHFGMDEGEMEVVGFPI